MTANINDRQWHTYRDTPQSFDPLATSTAVVNADGSPIQVIGGAVNQGFKGTIPQSWYVELTDGTNPLGTSLNPLSVTGTLVVNPPTPPATATDYNVASSGTSVVLLPANVNRKQATFFNDSTSIMYLDLNGGTASPTHYTIQIYPLGEYELPQTQEGTVYTGQITGVWQSANGFMRITEITP
jgi:hypothetical protein